MATKSLAHGMDAFCKDCEHPQTCWSMYSHEYTIRCRSGLPATPTSAVAAVTRSVRWSTEAERSETALSSACRAPRGGPGPDRYRSLLRNGCHGLRRRGTVRRLRHQRRRRHRRHRRHRRQGNSPRSANSWPAGPRWTTPSPSSTTRSAHTPGPPVGRDARHERGQGVRHPGAGHGRRPQSHRRRPHDVHRVQGRRREAAGHRATAGSQAITYPRLPSPPPTRRPGGAGSQRRPCRVSARSSLDWWSALQVGRGCSSRKV